MKTLRILGTRGVPAEHGGFETLAENLALYLVDKGWRVIVYCQEEGDGPIFYDTWHGVERVCIPVSQSRPKDTIIYDWKSIMHALKQSDLTLTLGYNTAVFCVLLRVKGIPNIVNMDGIEWKRHKWGAIAKIWFYINEWVGCWLGNHLIADHIEIKKLLLTRVRTDKITIIPYGADYIQTVPEQPVSDLGIETYSYLTLIARPEPENSILEIVIGFSSKLRGCKLVVLGNYESDVNEYHRDVIDAAGPEIMFLGAIYDKPIVQALRYYSIAYIHGHQVGGTNPSLVEAMGVSNPVIAHNNKFNRWVLGNSARYFSNSNDLSSILDEVLDNPEVLRNMKAGIVRRYKEEYTWSKVLSDYESLLFSWLTRA